MGSCAPSKTHRVKPIVLDLEQISQYPREGKVIIKTKNDNGKTIGHSNYTFQLTEPIKNLSKRLILGDLKYWASSCVLSGLDPRGEFTKSCQDNCVVLSNGFSTLFGLFDGHGPDGDKVSQFCCKFMETYYLE